MVRIHFPPAASPVRTYFFEDKCQRLVGPALLDINRFIAETNGKPKPFVWT
jgi:hypothetical protein